MYCAPAQQGLCSASDYVQLDSYAGQSATVTDMFSEADGALFRKILYNKTHVLHSIYLIGQKLYTRLAPDLIIGVVKTSDLNNRNFLVKAIYKDCCQSFICRTNYSIFITLLTMFHVSNCFIKET